MTDLFTAGDKITSVKLNQMCQKSVSYIIRKKGVNYEAINGTTNQIDYTSTAYATTMQNAIDATYTAGGGLIHHCAGWFEQAAPIYIKTRVWVEGEGLGTRIKPTADINSYIFTGGSWDMYIRNICFDDQSLITTAGGTGTHASPIHSALLFDNYDSGIYEIRIEDVWIDGWITGISMPSDSANTLNQGVFQNVKIFPRGDGLIIKNTQDILFNYVRVVYLPARGAETNSYGFRLLPLTITGVSGSFFFGCAVVAQYVANTNGLYIEDNAGYTFTDCGFDGADGYNLYITDSFDLWFENLWTNASYSDTQAHIGSDCHNIHFINGNFGTSAGEGIEVIAASGHPTLNIDFLNCTFKNNIKNGLLLGEYVTHCTINGGIAQANGATYSGIAIRNSQYNILTNLHADNNTYGVWEGGTADYNIVSNSRLTDNTKDGALIIGVNSHMHIVQNGAVWVP
jgi:parallel beta-helix repeat protein